MQNTFLYLILEMWYLYMKIMLFAPKLQKNKHPRYYSYSTVTLAKGQISSQKLLR